MKKTIITKNVLPILVVAAVSVAPSIAHAFNSAVYAGASSATATYNADSSQDQKRAEYLDLCVGQQMDRRYDITKSALTFTFNQQQVEQIRACVEQKASTHSGGIKPGHAIGMIGLIFAGSVIMARIAGASP